MNNKIIGAVILIVFAFGLIPGDYWKVLHHHQHYGVVHAHKINFTEKHKSCTNESHLYDFIPVQEFIKQTRIDHIQSLPTGNENNFPHPAFLNAFLRAPPVFQS